MRHIVKATTSFPPRLHTLLIVLLSLAVTLAGCSTAPSTTQSTPTVSAPPATVSIQLSWTHTIEWAGFYVAESKGLYAKQNLTVTLKPGGSDAQGNYIDPVAAVVGGQAEFGVTSGATILQARADGQPLVAIAAIYQRHPLALTSLAASNITKPQDLIGKKVHVSANSIVSFRAMLLAQKIDPAQVTIIDRSDFTIQPLISGEADVIDAWVTNEVATLKLQGIAVNTILPIDYGIDEYPNVIFTTEKLISEQPDLVERFLRATVAGLQGAIADPKSVAALAVGHDGTLNEAEQTESMNQSLPLISLPGSPPGMMNADTWTSTARIFTEQGLLKGTDDIKAAYNLTFLEHNYATK
jgi:ABC-type nitrate/sulfonate/bicarbonate transport system substrate-binding protein